MISILVDHNIEDQGRLIWNAVPLEEWAAFQIDQFYELPELGIAVEASDREIYRFLQSRRMMLLTGNRNNKGPDALESVLKEDSTRPPERRARRRRWDALESVLKEDSTPDSLPVVTIADVERVTFDAQYRFACATRLQEIAWLIDIYRAVPRLYIP